MKPLKQQELQTSANIPYPEEPRHSGQPWTNYHSDRHSVKDWGPSLTKQSEMDSCDINKIIAVHGIPENTKQGLFGDFSDSSSFLEAQQIISFANQQFAALPASVRQRFNNDPAQMLAFVDDPANMDEMVKIGLATKTVRPPNTMEAPEAKREAASAASKTKKGSGAEAPVPTAPEAD